MRGRAYLLAGAVLLGAALPAAAQDQSQTLADIRQQLSVLQVETQRLRGELNTTTAPNVDVSGDSVLQRVDSIESELRRLTQATEQLSFRVESVARDGGDRIEQLRFQLCELTTECSLGDLPPPTPLGGATGGTDTGAAAPASPAPAAPEMAMGEQADFDAAKAALDAGRHAEAAEALNRFVTAYPTGPLTGQAQLLRGQALAGSGDQAGAARAYLESFSGAPEGPHAPASLLGLGRTLAALGQTNEACLTLAEVAGRFPDAPEAGQAIESRSGLTCQ